MPSLNVMNRIVLLFFALLLLLATDIYVFQGFKLLVKKWVPAYQMLAYWVYWALPWLLIAGLFIMFGIGKNFSNSMALRFLFSITFIIYLSKLLWVVFMVLDDVVRLARYLLGASDIPNEAMMAKINRSEFIVSAGALVSSSLFGGLIYGIMRGAHNYRVIKRTVPIKGLPQEFEGLKIVQLSDIHAGSFWNKEAVKRGIEIVNEQKPDIILFTGDLVNDRAEEFQGYQSIFGQLQAKYGIFSVLGNHDYGDYTNWPDKNGLSKKDNLLKLIAMQREMGWDLLLDEHRKLDINGRKLGIIGVENYSAHSRFPKYGNLQEAYKGVEDADVKLLMSHDPSHWRDEILGNYKDISVTFSGHTHGMQFGIDSKYYRWSPVKYQYPEWADLYEESGQFLYVNRGFGYIGYPGRLGIEPEITVVELTRA